MMQENAGHNIILENRKKVLLTGVKDVLGFDDQTITAVTNLGDITIKGNMLKMGNFSTDKGELQIEGDIVALVYTQGKTGGGLLSKLFK